MSSLESTCANVAPTDIEQAASAVQAAGLSDQLLALPREITIHDLEQYQDAPRRLVGTFSTSSIDDFCSYVQHWQPQIVAIGDSSDNSAEALVFVNTDGMQARAVLDMGTLTKPMHAGFTASITLQATAAYASWLDTTTAARHSQRGMSDWLEEWRDYIEYLGADQSPMSAIAALQAVRTVSMKASANRESEVGQFAAQTSNTSSIQVTSRDGELPAFIKFKTVPFTGLGECQMIGRLSLTFNDDETPKLNLRYMRRDLVEEGMADEFCQLVSDQLNDTTVFKGTFK